MKSTYEETALFSNGEMRTCTIVAEGGHPVCNVEVGGDVIGLRRSSADDLFKALQMIRIELDKEGIRLCCNGARSDVWPSGMSREMSLGQKAYILRPGLHSRREDLVDIFDSAPTEA